MIGIYQSLQLYSLVNLYTTCWLPINAIPCSPHLSFTLNVKTVPSPSQRKLSTSPNPLVHQRCDLLMKRNKHHIYGKIYPSLHLFIHPYIRVTVQRRFGIRDLFRHPPIPTMKSDHHLLQDLFLDFFFCQGHYKNKFMRWDTQYSMARPLFLSCIIAGPRATNDQFQ